MKQEKNSSQIKLLIKDVYQNLDQLAKTKQLIKIVGRVLTNRGNKNIGFLAITDSSILDELQVVYKKDTMANFMDISSLKRNCIVEVIGTIHLTPNRAQQCELINPEIRVLIEPLSESPLQKKAHTLEYLRSIAHLRIQTNLFKAINKIKSEAFWSVHNFYHNRGFTYIQTPLITNNDAEGGGESFFVTTKDNKNNHLDFFGKQATLTVSGQLHAESYAQALQKVYTFGPTFRAENSNTTKHISEFWMLEPEFIHSNLQRNMDLIEDTIKAITQHIKSTCLSEINLLAKKTETNLLDIYDCILNNQFPRITYTEALDYLAAAQQKNNIFPGITFKFGLDLQTEHEQYIAVHKFKGPGFIFNYPKAIKAFYMKVNDDEQTVAACDLLVPRVGELVGGSARENDYSRLVKRCQAMNININSLNWYLNLRKFGYASSAGFGLGFERLLMYLTGVQNIRDISSFPSSARNLYF